MAYFRCWPGLRPSRGLLSKNRSGNTPDLALFGSSSRFKKVDIVEGDFLSPLELPKSAKSGVFPERFCSGDPWKTSDLTKTLKKRAHFCP